MEISDLKPGMKFKATGEGGRIYTLIMDTRNKSTPRNGEIKLKRQKDGLILSFNTGRFIDLVNKSKITQEGN